jgi:hypothetical protein
MVVCYFLNIAYRGDASPVMGQALQGILWLPVLYIGWTQAWGCCASTVRLTSSLLPGSQCERQYLSKHNRSRQQRHSHFNHLAQKVKPSSLPPAWISAVSASRLRLWRC